MITSYSITRSLVILELILPHNHAKTTELQVTVTNSVSNFQI